MNAAFSYQSRPVSFLEVWEPDAWKIKLYGIAYARARPAPELVEAARTLAAPLLAAARDHYGVGFMGVHQGKTADFIFLDWWARENELNHHVFISSPGQSPGFVDATASGVMACVWDLAVIGHERQAWIDCVLKAGADDRFAAYLGRRLQGEV